MILVTSLKGMHRVALNGLFQVVRNIENEMH